MHKRFLRALFLVGIGSFIGQACNDENANKSNGAVEDTTTSDVQVQINTPEFNADSAYQYIYNQVAFGPRVPGSEAHKKCADYLINQLGQFTDTVYVQNTTVKRGDGKQMPCTNIIGAINPQATDRILLLAHWDSRPWADHDPVAKTEPILGADDGGSGVGVLIELARQLQAANIRAELGIDILFVDAEDSGQTDWGSESYCLGAQYWARNPHVAGYRAKFGILLDMVGARGATFKMEGISRQYAMSVLNKVWQAASHSGYSSYFPFMTHEAEIVDDHYFINTIARIPTIDIINLDATTRTGFGSHWHTQADDMKVIDKNTLKAVGQTLLNVLIKE